MGNNNRITIFIGGLGGGGAERVVCNLANYLAGEKWNVNILTMSDTRSAYYLQSNVQVYPLITQCERKNFFYNSSVRYMRLKKYVQESKTDCFIVMLPETMLLLLFLKKRAKAKIIASERSNPSKYSKGIKVLIKILAHRADGFVFQTEETCEWYKPYTKKVKTTIIPNAVNQEFLAQNDQVVKENRIITTGRLIKSKNIPLVIKAFALIADQYSEYRLFIFGSGPEKSKLESLAEELKLAHRVVISEFCSNIKEEMLKSKLFVLSSNYEGMPNALIEAMALGLPCVATDCAGGGAKALIRHDVNGYLTEVGNAEQMAHYMDLILSSEEVAERIGNRASNIKKRLNPSRIYSAWENFIIDINSR